MSAERGAARTPTLNEQIDAALFAGYGMRIRPDELWPGIEPDRLVRDRSGQISNPLNDDGMWDDDHE